MTLAACGAVMGRLDKYEDVSRLKISRDRFLDGRSEHYVRPKSRRRHKAPGQYRGLPTCVEHGNGSSFMRVVLFIVNSLNAGERHWNRVKKSSGDEACDEINLFGKRNVVQELANEAIGSNCDIRSAPEAQRSWFAKRADTRARSYTSFSANDLCAVSHGKIQRSAGLGRQFVAQRTESRSCQFVALLGDGSRHCAGRSTRGLADRRRGLLSRASVPPRSGSESWQR